jgi:hypothetical protein
MSKLETLAETLCAIKGEAQACGTHLRNDQVAWRVHLLHSYHVDTV